MLPHVVQNPILEYGEVVLRVAQSANHAFEFARDVVNSQCSVQTGLLDNLPCLLSAATYFSYQQESLLANALGEFAHGIAERSQGLGAHVFGGVESKSVNVGISNPEAIGQYQAGERRRELAGLLLLLGPEVEGLQGEHVGLDIFRIVVPISDVSTAAELGNVLEFTGPDSAIRPRTFEPGSIVEIPRYGWLTVTIIEPAHGVTI